MSTVNIRGVLAIFWSIVAALLMGYILIVHGDEKEILTLIIGMISGTILGSIFGVYFSANHTSSKPVINQEADTITNAGTPGANPDQTT